MVAAVLVQLERHNGHPGQERGALLRHSAPQHQPTDPCTTLTVVAFAGQPSPAGCARAAALAHGGHLRRDHLGLERRRALLRLVEPQPEVGQASLLAALATRAPDRAPLSPWSRRAPAPPPASHATPASTPSHPLPVSLEPTRKGTSPHGFACSRRVSASAKTASALSRVRRRSAQIARTAAGVACRPVRCRRGLDPSNR